ncbi:MAG: hypothetical protein LBC02_04865, partial [Planctomycetaceae bacterium]|nr:hypothetical protein [Planctomycetaceae bacterium]
MKSQFFTGLVLVTLLLSGGVARVALPADVKDGTELLNTLDNSTDTNINLTGNINTRLMDTSDPNNHLPTGFTPVPIERVITITSSGTTTISYGTTTQKAEDD